MMYGPSPAGGLEGKDKDKKDILDMAVACTVFCLQKLLGRRNLAPVEMIDPSWSCQMEWVIEHDTNVGGVVSLASAEAVG